MPANYYEAFLSEWPAFSRLSLDQVCDVVIVGGGLLGASTALHLAEAGLDAIVIEKDNIGSGESGRNGGQATPGLARWEAATMLSTLSSAEAGRLWRFAGAEALHLVDELSARYDFACDRKSGHIYYGGPCMPGWALLVENADARRQLGDAAVRIIGLRELKEYVRSDIYHGAAIIDRAGGVRFIRWRCCAAWFTVLSAGAAAFMKAPPCRISRKRPPVPQWLRHTGIVRARKARCAGDSQLYISASSGGCHNNTVFHLCRGDAFSADGYPRTAACRYSGL